MYRIVHNSQTDTYRIERKGFFGWNFVQEKTTGDYLQFADLEAAQDWVETARARRVNPLRRWRVVSECSA